MSSTTKSKSAASSKKSKQTIDLQSRTYLLFKCYHDLYKKMPKVYKHNIGQNCLNLVTDMIAMVIRAAMSEVKEPKLRFTNEVVVLCAVFENYARLLLDVKCITAAEYTRVCEHVTDISDQTRSWRTWIESQM